MDYISTRGEAPALGFSDALLAGLASDGGLYVPRTWPVLTKREIRALRGLSYQDAAFEILYRFTGGEIPADDFKAMIVEAYATFRHPAVAPLVQTGPNAFILELFHGTTLAFKDVAMQLIGRLMDYVLEKRGERATIVGATSGDTGGAAIDAFAGRDRTDIFILFPEGKVSPVQQRQMTTSTDKNVHAMAVEGQFRRLPEPGEGHVQRCALPRQGAPVGRQLHQLGAHHGAGGLLLHHRRVARRAGPQDVLHRADGQFRRYLRRLSSRRNGPAHRPSGDRHQRKRHPGPHAAAPGVTK